MAKRGKWKRRLIKGIAILIIVAIPIGYFAWYKFFREVPQPEWITSDPEMNFLYGSIGAEAISGLPYWILVVLPRIFGDYIPAPGGYAAFGLPWEEGRELPAGFSKKTIGFDRVGFNCAVCHSTQYRTREDETPTIVAGGGSHTTDVQGLLEFLSRCAEDERFNADTILTEIDLAYPLSKIDRALYKYLFIPLVRNVLKQQGQSWAWTADRPRWGPGRDAPMNLTKFILLEMEDDGTVDHTDFPSLWNLQTRVQEGRVWPAHDYSLTADFSKLDVPLDRLMLMNLAGDTTSYRSVIIDSALGLQVPPDGPLPTPDPITPFFRKRIAEIEEWMLNVPAPAYPLTYRPEEATQGEVLFATHCADCHESGRDNRLGTVIPLEEIGTDPARTQSWTREAADAANETVVNGLGMERTPMSKPYDGYVALQMDGLWLRAPYLHNGSVPTVRALLEPPECRPKIFYRGYDLLDGENMGFAALQCDDEGQLAMEYEPPEGCEREVLTGCVPSYNKERYFRFDTAEVGNGNDGHTYGTELIADEKRALVEYLKKRDRGSPEPAKVSQDRYEGETP